MRKLYVTHIDGVEREVLGHGCNNETDYAVYSLVLERVVLAGGCIEYRWEEV